MQEVCPCLAMLCSWRRSQSLLSDVLMGLLHTAISIGIVDSQVPYAIKCHVKFYCTSVTKQKVKMRKSCFDLCACKQRKTVKHATDNCSKCLANFNGFTSVLIAIYQVVSTQRFNQVSIPESLAVWPRVQYTKLLLQNACKTFWSILYARACVVY